MMGAIVVLVRKFCHNNKLITDVIIVSLHDSWRWMATDGCNNDTSR